MRQVYFFLFIFLFEQMDRMKESIIYTQSMQDELTFIYNLST